MEILLLCIYSFFAWLVFGKFKWLPWNITTQVITVTIPIIGLTIVILLLNIYAPSSGDVRVINYVVQVVPLTRTIRSSSTEVVIDPDDGNRLAERSSAQCQHVRSVATTRIQHRAGNVGPVALGEVRETLALLLDL